MRKLLIPTILLVVTLIVIMSFTISSKTNYVKIPEYTHSQTKAFCTSENFCQDYQIFCKNQELVSMSPITGAAVQFSSTWQDPRSSEIRNRDC